MKLVTQDEHVKQFARVDFQARLWILFMYLVYSTPNSFRETNSFYSYYIEEGELLLDQYWVESGVDYTFHITYRDQDLPILEGIDSLLGGKNLVFNDNPREESDDTDACSFQNIDKLTLDTSLQLVVERLQTDLVLNTEQLLALLDSDELSALKEQDFKLDKGELL